MAARRSLKYLFTELPQLRWHERFWVGLPFGLVLVGGAVGGACGAAAAACNLRVMRGRRPAFQKYLLTGLVSLAAVIAYLALATLFLSLAGRRAAT
jgi:hypothetical protein